MTPRSVRVGGVPSSIISISLLLLMLAADALPVSAGERLLNGGFEQGTAHWAPSFGFSTSGSCSRGGALGGALVTSIDDQSAFVQQAVSGPLSEGAYVLTGYARLQSGNARLTAHLLWLDSSGTEIGRTDTDFDPGASYAQFRVERPALPLNAVSVTVRIRIVSERPATVCLDDLSLDGPPLATPTSTPSFTATVSPTPTATASPASTPTATSTATLVPASTSTRTPTAVSTAPLTASAPESAFVFVNGGFEDGVSGWQKFGGELLTVGSPRVGGVSAGAFRSATASTKWAYQIVRVDASLAYEFQGDLRPDSGVSQAYLRISWYESADGGGSAIATDDSLTRIDGGSSGFVHLTTGSRRPPASARSARVRVMLAPLGAGAATLYLDDFAFGLAAAGSIPLPVSTVAAPDEPVAPAAAAPVSLASATPRSVDAPARTPRPRETGAPAAAVAGVREPRPRSTQAVGEVAQLPAAKDSGGRGIEVVVGAGALFLIALGGAYLYARRPGLRS